MPSLSPTSPAPIKSNGPRTHAAVASRIPNRGVDALAMLLEQKEPHNVFFIDQEVGSSDFQQVAEYVRGFGVNGAGDALASGINIENAAPIIRKFVFDHENPKLQEARRTRDSSDHLMQKLSNDHFYFPITNYGPIDLLVDRDEHGSRLGLIVGFRHDLLYFPAFDFDHPTAHPNDCWGSMTLVPPSHVLADVKDVADFADDAVILGTYGSLTVFGINASRSGELIARSQDTRGKLLMVEHEELPQLKVNVNDVVPDGRAFWNEQTDALVPRHGLVEHSLDYGRYAFNTRAGLFVGIDDPIVYASEVGGFENAYQGRWYGDIPVASSAFMTIVAEDIGLPSLRQLSPPRLPVTELRYEKAAEDQQTLEQAVLTL